MKKMGVALHESHNRVLSICQSAMSFFVHKNDQHHLFKPPPTSTNCFLGLGSPSSQSQAVQRNQLPKKTQQTPSKKSQLKHPQTSTNIKIFFSCHNSNPSNFPPIFLSSETPASLKVMGWMNSSQQKSPWRLAGPDFP